MNENMEPNATPTPTPAPKKANPLVWIIAIIVLAAAMVGGWYAGRQFANSEDDEERTSEKSSKKSSKDKDDDDDDEEEEEETKKDTKKKTATGTKQIVCSGEYAEMATISVNFDYSNAKETITAGSMSMQLDFKKLAESEGQTLTEEDIKTVLEAMGEDLGICDSFKDDERFASCNSGLNGTVLNVDLDLDVDEMLSELTDEDKKVDADELAQEIEDGLNADEFEVTCRVK